MRTKLSRMLDINTFEEQFGIKVSHRGVWKHYAENGDLYVVNSLEQANTKRRELRKFKEMEND